MCVCVCVCCAFVGLDNRRYLHQNTLKYTLGNFSKPFLDKRASIMNLTNVRVWRAVEIKEVTKSTY
jgi:hypothetical protein